MDPTSIYIPWIHKFKKFVGFLFLIKRPTCSMYWGPWCLIFFNDWLKQLKPKTLNQDIFVLIFLLISLSKINFSSYFYFYTFKQFLIHLL